MNAYIQSRTVNIDGEDYLRLVDAMKIYRRSDTFFYTSEAINFYHFPHTNKTTKNQKWLQSSERGYTYLKVSELEAITIHNPST